jgi:hypothetical protein
VTDAPQLDTEQTPAAVDTADFDAFFAEEAPARPRQSLILYGKRYELPAAMPLMFTLQAQRMHESSDPRDVRRMLATLFGRDALDEWAEHGMDERQFTILFIYAGGNIAAPGSLTMADAAKLYDEQEERAAEAGKAPANRAQRRAKPKGKGKKRPNSGRRS